MFTGDPRQAINHRQVIAISMGGIETIPSHGSCFSSDLEAGPICGGTIYLGMSRGKSLGETWAMLCDIVGILQS